MSRIGAAPSGGSLAFFPSPAVVVRLVEDVLRLVCLGSRLGMISRLTGELIVVSAKYPRDAWRNCD